jgi:hypothetical protein
MKYDKPILKKRRFFYHYNKRNHKMTVHFMGVCNIVDDVECRVGCESKWNKSQPQLVMRGWAYNVHIVDNKAIIS